MAIPLPYASALGEAGLRVAAMGESTAKILRVPGPFVQCSYRAKRDY
jgi:hypothetical protein